MEKLSQLVDSLNQFEQNAFQKYLDSPFFQVSPRAKSLFRNLAEGTRPSKSSKSGSYPASELTRHLENFLALRHLERDPYALPVANLHMLAERDCEKAWKYAFNEIRKQDRLLDAGYHLCRLQAGENALGYLAGKQSRKKEADYTELFSHLDAFYCSKKLQYCCEVINRQNLLAAATELPFLRDLLVQSANQLDHPAVSIYFHILHTLLEPDQEAHFNQAWAAVKKYSSKLPAREILACHTYLKNYCIRKMNRGETGYATTLFEVYQEYLSTPSLLRLGPLSQFEFKNIVSLSLRLNAVEWCAGFIRKFSYRLPAGEKKNAVTYNTAYYHFMTGNFRLAIRMLRDVEFTDVVYQLDARVVLLKCFYELNDQEAFFYHASAFRLFLLRNRYISEFQKTLNRNLIRYLTSMLRDQYSAVKVTRLKAAIAQARDVADIRWLREKAELL